MLVSAVRVEASWFSSFSVSPLPEIVFPNFSQPGELVRRKRLRSPSETPCKMIEFCPAERASYRWH